LVLGKVGGMIEEGKKVSGLIHFPSFGNIVKGEGKKTLAGTHV
jgi:hypothetical protein